MKLFFDTETTGLPVKTQNWEENFKDFPHIVQIAWIITDDNENEIDREVNIIKPNNYIIPQEAIDIHKITTDEANLKGIKESIILKAFLHDAQKCNEIIGHNIYFDTSIIKASLLRLKVDKELICNILHKDKRYDTMQKGMKLLGINKWPKLSELYQNLFNEEMKNAHNAIGDVEAMMKCYFALNKK